MKRALLASLLLTACAHPRLDDPPLDLTINVVGLRDDERLVLRDAVCSIDGVSSCQLVTDAPPPDAAGGKKAKKKPPPPSPEAKITLKYRGSLGELRHKIKALPHPGLEAKGADVVLSYRGFDNLPPKITIEGPKDGTVIAEKMIGVVAIVPDVDVAEVTIGGKEALPQSGGRYLGDADLQEGDNAVVVTAVDQAGNKAEARVKVLVDTTPPTVQVEVQILAYDKALVKGQAKDAAKIAIDGKDVSLDLFGNFEREVKVDPDKSFIDVVATDANGNTKKIRRSAKIASPMGEQSK